MARTQTGWAKPVLQEEAELHVVAFYEDPESGEWAKEIVDRIRSRMPHARSTTPHLWGFDALENEDLGALASVDAASAAVIIVAAHGASRLPARLLDCVEQALVQQRSARVGLVAVMENTDGKPRDALSAYRRLQAISRKAKLPFFSLACENLIDRAAVTDGFHFAPKRLLDHSLFFELRSYRAWGINE